jgi:outer membrane lipoprotein-sorting protein
MKRLRKLSMVLMCLLYSGLTYSDFADLQIDRITHNLHKVKSFQGTLVQKGLLGNEQVTSLISYKYPHRVHSQILAPPSIKGISMSYDGKTFLFYYPKANYAIRFKNIIAPEKEGIRQYIEDQYKSNLKLFNYSFGKSTKIADLSVFVLNQKSKAKKALISTGSTMVYDKYSYPLGGSLVLRSGHEYQYQFKKISFNTNVSDVSLSIKLPITTFITEWDLADKGSDLKEVKKKAPYLLIFPKEGPVNLVRQKIIAKPGFVPSYLGYYTKGIYFLLVTSFQETGISLAPDNFGIPISTPQKGRLIISSSVSSFSFTKDKIRYVMMGNIPFDKMITFSKKFGPEKNRK